MSPRRVSRPLLAFAAVLVALAFPGAAQALNFKIVNQSVYENDEVWITVAGEEAGFDVPEFSNDVPKQLSLILNQELTINYVKSGRVYVAYGKSGVTKFEADSPIRFDWVELSEEQTPGDVANLTAVDQFGIGMRLDSFGTSDEPLEELGSANSNTIFAALQAIPGGPGATVRDPDQNILRVLSPTHTSAYPDLGEYVRSMAGKPIELHSTFSGPGEKEFTTSAYSGSFAADGSIALTGTTEGPASAPGEIVMPGNELIEDVYTGGNTPNNLEGAIRHDVLVGFMAGYWDGRYGNDAIGFCTDPELGTPQHYCRTGFDQPAFGAARAGLSPFPTCEQYAAVINQYADMYGNPYSDGASGKVTIPINKSGSKDVKTLQLTILPDSGDAQPVSGGNPECGAATGSGSGGASSSASGPNSKRHAASRVSVHTKLLKRTQVRRGELRVARIACSVACGRVRAVVRKGKRVLARALVKRSGRKRLVVAHLTRPGLRLLHRRRRLKVRLDLWVAPDGRRATHRHRELLLVR
jgi:hypothetical protein